MSEDGLERAQQRVIRNLTIAFLLFVGVVFVLFGLPILTMHYGGPTTIQRVFECGIGRVHDPQNYEECVPRPSQ
jgi:hypothetical protein